ncbi:MAG: cytochrome-c oxidase [Ignavibacteriales bacterium CG_4_9_14_3_um_filter_30_11]|nr:MAG: cytochrome-c oxidase [Ignavibacteriales bacterium CG_4_9_14_3_um_filter_30_11]
MEGKDKHTIHNHSYTAYIIVWLALLTFTAITVAVAGINFGNSTIAIALIIASIKTYLVLTIFMHLKLENKTFKIFVIIAIFFLVISFILLFSDYSNI